MRKTRGTALTKTLCDKCGSPALAVQEAYKYRIAVNGKMMDLCPNCYRSLCAFVHDPRERVKWEGNHARDN